MDDTEDFSISGPLVEARRRLPTYSLRGALVDAILRAPSRVCVIAGQTGSGKSTQLPQYLLECGRARVRRITVTQPRRVAAMTLARRVARERGCRLGEEVGYFVRFDQNTCEQTRIRYATDGVIVREALLDSRFSRDDFVFVDEAHERSVSTDLLLGVLKQALALNKGLRVVVMSATLDATAFATFFESDSVFFIQGRQFPIRHYFCPAPEKSYVDATTATVLQIHAERRSDLEGLPPKEAGRGHPGREGERGGRAERALPHILAFLPGEHEIESVASALRARCRQLGILYGDSPDGGDPDESEGSENEYGRGGDADPGAGRDPGTAGDSMVASARGIESVAKVIGAKRRSRPRKPRSKVQAPEAPAEPGEDVFDASADEGVGPAAGPEAALPPLEVLTLFASMQSQAQLRVFDPAPPGVRRVILATNIAETSVTVPGVAYVVDCGLVRQKVFDPRSSVSSLVTVPCSQAAIVQRAGRAGREGPGFAYHLYTYDTFTKLEEHDLPEILRDDLSSTLLTLVGCGFTNPVAFDFISIPAGSSIRSALLGLARLGAIEPGPAAGKAGKEQGAPPAEPAAPALQPVIRLTPLGKEIIQFPLPPGLARAILQAAGHGPAVLTMVLAIVSVLSGDQVFVGSADAGRREDLQLARLQFRSNWGDHLMLYNVWKCYHAQDFESSQAKLDWCRRYGVSHRTLDYAAKVFGQLAELYNRSAASKRCGYRLNPAERLAEEVDDGEGSRGAGGEALSPEEAVLSSLCAGFFSNVARLNKDGRTYATHGGEARVHPSTCLNVNALPELVLYDGLLRTSCLYMKVVSEIQESWVSE